MTDTHLAPVDDAEGPDFASIPAAGPEAEVDEHWLDLRGGSTLPSLYMPPSMPGWNDAK